MNKVYKVVWNAALGAWCAVSELGKSNKKTKSLVTRNGIKTKTAMTTILATGLTSLAISMSAQANTIDSALNGSTDCTSQGSAVAYKVGKSPTTSKATDGTGTFSTVAGCNSSASGQSAATVYGTYATVNGRAGTAVGFNSSASTYAVAMGVDAQATSAKSISIGAGAGLSGTTANTVAIGADTTASGANSTLLGTAASSTVDGGVALGNGSTASIASGTQGYDPLTNKNSTSNTTTWQSNTGAVAVGNGTTTTRQITSVAAGTADTDAVNVAQLKNAQTYSSNVANGIKTVLGGNATVGTDGTVSTTSIGGTGSNTVDGAISSVKSSTATAQTAANNAQATADKGLNFTANKGTADNVKLGDSVDFSNGTNTAVTYDAANNSYKYSVVDAPSFAGQVKANGFDANGKTVTNVANGAIGSSSTDAVNGAQVAAISNSTKGLLGGNATVNSDGTVTTSDIGGTGSNTIDGAVTSLKDQATKAKTTVTNGLNTVVTPTTNKDGSTNYQVATAKDLVVNSVTAGNTLVNNTGVMLDDGQGNSTVVTPISTRIANNSSRNSISGGGSQLVSADSQKKASYLTEGIQLIDTANGANKEADLTTSGFIVGDGSTGNITKVNADGLRVTNGPSVTTAGIDAANKVVTSVAAGVADTDAVNVGQLTKSSSTVGNSIASALGGGSTYNPATGTVSAPTYSVNDSSKNNVGDAISALDQGFTVTSNGANGKAIKAGDTLEIGTVDGEKNLTVSKDGNSIKYGLNRNLDVDSVTVGNTKVVGGGLSTVDESGNTLNATASTVVLADQGNNMSSALNNSQIGFYDKNTQASGVMSTNGFAATEGTKIARYGIDNAIVTDTQAKKTALMNTSGFTVGDGNTSNITKVNADGLRVTNGPSVTTTGIDAANKVVTNVAAGVADTDAVNVGQLTKSSSTVGNSIASALGGGSTYDPTTGTVSAPTYSVNGSSKNNVGDAISALDQGFTVTSNGANGKAIKAGDTLEIGTADGEKNLTVSKDGNTIKYGLNRNLDLDSVKAGNTTLNNAGVAVDDGTGNVSKLTTAGTTVADSAGNNASYGAKEASLKDSAGNTNTSTATGNTVADSAGNSTATTAAGNTVKDSSGNSSVYGASGSTLTDKAGNTTVVDTKGLSFKDTTGAVTGPSITASGVNAGGKAVTNVGDAVNSTDAVNKKLLDEVTSAGSAKTDASGNSTASALGGGSTYDPTTGTVSAPTYSVNGSSKNNVGDAISALDQGFTVTSNGANGKAIKAGDTLEIGTADGEKNLTVSKDGNTIKYGLNRDLDLDSVKAGNTTLNNAGVAVDDGTGNVSKLTTAGTTVADSAGNNASYGAKEASLKDSAGNTNTSTATGNTVADSAGNSTATTAAGNTVKDSSGNSSVYGASGSTLTDKAGNTTVVDTKGLSFKDTTGAVTGPSITASGVNAGGKAVTNVGDAVNSTDAVNKKLLDEATSAGSAKTDASGNSTASALGGGSTYDPTTGTVSAPTYSVNGSSKNNVGDAISALDQGFTVTSNGANGKAIKAGDTLEIGTADGEKNLTVSKDGNSIKYGLNRDLDLDSVKAGNTTLNNAGVAVDDGTGNVSKLTTAGTTVADSAGNNASYGAKEASLKDSAGNTNTSTATGNTVADSAGNSTATTAAGNTVKDSSGNSSVYGASGSTLTDKAGNTTVVDTKGLSFKDTTGAVTGPSITASGVNAGGKAVTNVGDAVNSTDAVNKKLLDEATSAGSAKTDASGNSTASALGGGSTYDPTTGTVSAPTYSVNGSSKNNVGDAISALDQGFTVTSNGANGKAIKAGDTLEIGTADGEKNLTVSKDGNTIKYGLNRDLDLDSVKAGNTTLNNAGVAVDDGTGNVSKLTTAGTTVADSAGNNASYGAKEASLKDSAGNTNTSTATGNTVADSAGNSTATTAAGNTVKDSSGNSSVYGASGSTLTDKAGNTTVVDTKGLSFKDTTGAVTGPSITASGVNAGGKAVTNVGDAVNSTDAVNKKLLDEATSAGSAKTDASGNSTASALGGGSTYDPTTGTVSAPTYSVNGSSKNNVGDAISALDQGFTVTSNGANGKAIKAGDTLEIGTADGEKNLTVSKDGNTIKYGLNRDLDLDSVKAGNTTLNNAGVAVDDGTGNVSKLTTAGTTVADSAGNNASYGAKEASLKDSAGNSTSTTASGTNVADKNGNSNSLTATGNTIKDNAGNSTTSSASGVTVADGLGNSTAVTATGVNVAGGPSLTKTGLDVAGGTITNLKGGQIATGSTDAVTGGQVAEVQSQLQKQLGSVGDSAVQYAQNSDGTTNYDSILAGNGKGTTATLGTDSYGNSIVTGGGTTISNVANAVKASDAVNKGQLDSAISSNITDVKDGNGNGVSVTDQVVNRNYNATNPDPDSLFLTYNKAGQTTTDNLTIGETVQKMNKEGVKFAHTNAAIEAKDSSAGGTNSTALGVNAIASTDAANSVVIGNNSSVSGTSSVAIGDGATASGTQSISIGTGNTVSGNHSGAFGDPSTITGNESYVLGNNNTVSTDNTFVVGNNVTQTTAGSVVLGTGSAARTAGGVAGFAPAKASTTDASAIAATASTTGAVAVGDATNNVYRQVTGVAAGTANSDAVNVAQLKSVDNKVDTSTASIATALGGGATVNSDGSISNPTYTVGGTTSTTLAGALSALDAAVKNANTSGKDVNVTSVTAGNTALDTNGVSTKDNAGNSSQLAANGLTVSNANTGNSAQYGADNATYTAKNGSSTSIGTNGLNFKDSSGNATGPSVTASGINAGGQTITNVANGVNSSDAVNKGQLDSAVSGVTSSVSQLANSAVQYDTKADGSVNKDKITLGGSNGTTITNVADGVIASGSKDAVNGGQLANVQSQVTANTNNISSLQNTVSSIGSGKTGIVQQASNDAAINIGKDSAGTQVNVANSSGTSRTVSGVASGKVSSSSTDAVNGAQVYNVSAATAAALGGGSAVQADGTVSQPSYSVGGSSYNNVGGAISAVDGKLTGLDGRVGNLESAFAQTNQQMNKLRNETNAGIAGAMAVGNLPQPTEAGKSMVSAGISGYRGEGAVAVGVSAITDSNKYVWKMGATADTRSNISGAMSVGYQW